MSAEIKGLLEGEVSLEWHDDARNFFVERMIAADAVEVYAVGVASPGNHTGRRTLRVCRAAHLFDAVRRQGNSVKAAWATDLPSLMNVSPPTKHLRDPGTVPRDAKNFRQKARTTSSTPLPNSTPDGVALDSLY
jgi:hypothetical protein